jgi:catechol 2,3-dioxygenase-like lactoylglutathione lyase family enzyme
MLLLGAPASNAEGAKPAYATTTLGAPMPSLENLKKQAKLIVRWHRERYYPVAAQIRDILPRFKDLNDAEILAQSFKLAEAQEMVARRNGFDTWEALTKGLEKMLTSETPSSDQPVLLTAEPQLFVRDIEASCRYFCDKLGFKIAFLYGEPPFYGQVARDGVALNLRCTDRPLIDTEQARRNDFLSASINVNDVKSLYLSFQQAGIAFHQTLRKEPWGATTFIVADPDGNLILFA